MRCFNYLIAIYIAICLFKGQVFAETNEHDHYDVDDELTYSAIKNLNDGDYELIQFWSGERLTPRGIQREVRFKRDAPKLYPIVRQGGHNLIREKTPVWIARKDQELERVDDTILKEAIKYYEDPEGVAKLYEVKHDADSHGYFTGHIAKRSVRPLSERAAQVLREQKPHLFNDTQTPGTVDGNFVLSPYHVLFKEEDDRAVNTVFEDLINDIVEDNDSPKKKFHKMKRSTDVVYPEILLVLDYGKKFSSVREFRFFELLTYAIGFWNSVNLRYETLNTPGIQLRITGILINMEREALPFIKSSLEPDGKYLQAEKMLRQLPNWVWTQRGIPTDGFDVIMTMTNLNLCDRKKSTDTCEKSRLLGLALTGQPCQNVGFLVGVSHDKYDYSGITSAAHELGHVLGANHDNKTYAIECSEDDGFIMAPVYDVNMPVRHPFRWSSCSLVDFEKHLRDNPEMKCLENSEPKHDQGAVLDDLFPGHKISLEAQCQKLGYSTYCETSTLCSSLHCQTTLGICEFIKGSALDGTPCGDGGHCMNGLCEIPF